jgi:hypothetical protein
MSLWSAVGKILFGAPPKQRAKSGAKPRRQTKKLKLESGTRPNQVNPEVALKRGGKRRNLRRHEVMMGMRDANGEGHSPWKSLTIESIHPPA